MCVSCLVTVQKKKNCHPLDLETFIGVHDLATLITFKCKVLMYIINIINTEFI